MIKRLFKSLLFVVLISPLTALGMESKSDEIFWGKCLVLHAIQDDSDQFERLLWSKKCDLNQKDQQDGRTALMIAAGNGNKKIVRMLIRCRADLNLQCIMGETALISAAAIESPEIMAMLIDAGANLNLQTKDGYTALTAAAWFGGISSCYTLIDEMLKRNKEQKECIYAFLQCIKRVPRFTGNLPRDLFKPILLPSLTDVLQEINRIANLDPTSWVRKEIRDKLLAKYGFQPTANEKAKL